MTNADRVVKQATRPTLPAPGNECHLRVPRAMPSVTILVHGVNDVGEAYEAQEQGLCHGLNERLNRFDLVAAGYSRPAGDRLTRKPTADPDATSYQRTATPQQTLSPIIPFYWGFREEEGKITKTGKHGEWLDRYGNRLDKRGAKGGGPFINATSSIPAMWGEGASGKLGGIAIDAIAGTPTNPLLPAHDRFYFVLAARRLATLIRMIRRYDRDDTVNVIGHSQGTMVVLLAQAFLHDEGERAADCLILNNAPYSLARTWAMGVDSGPQLQTVRARLDTLVNIVRYVCRPHPKPAFGDLTDATKCNGLTGSRWGEYKTIGGARYSAVPERDNRGKVYLYFCPDDHATSVDAAASIGWQGVPDGLNLDVRVRGYLMRQPVKPLEMLGQGFKQRVWRAPQYREEVGRPPGYKYRMVDVRGDRYRQGIDPRETRTITGEELAPTCSPRIDFGDTGRGKRTIAVGPIDAAIAATRPESGRPYDPQFFVDHCGLSRDEAYRATKMRDWRPAGPHSALFLDVQDLKEAQRQWDEPKATEADRSTIRSAMITGDGWIQLTRDESANETKLRYMRHQVVENTYHSGIVANPEHHRQVTAYDLAVGQAKNIDDPDRLDFLVHFADWRTNWADIKKDPSKSRRLLETLGGEPKDVRALVDCTFLYYTTGVLPHSIPDAGSSCLRLPSLVVSETEIDALRQARNPERPRQ